MGYYCKLLCLAVTVSGTITPPAHCHQTLNECDCRDTNDEDFDACSRRLPPKLASDGQVSFRVYH